MKKFKLRIGMGADELVCNLGAILGPKVVSLSLVKYCVGLPNIRTDKQPTDIYKKLAYSSLIDELGLGSISRGNVARSLDINTSARRITSHSDDFIEAFSVAPNQINATWMRRKVAQHRSKYAKGGPVIALRSICQLASGDTAHIPMLDFRCPISKRAEMILLSCLRSIGLHRGLLLESGNSYHFIGLNLIEQQDLYEFIGKSLLLLPLIDGRYLGHRMLNGSLSLRITSCPEKPKVPKIVQVLDQGL